MAGRGGRGGGRGGMSFKLEGILGAGESIPGPCLQPAPTYPPLEHHPSPLVVSAIALTQLSSKLDFLSHFTREVKSLNYPWDYFPAELRPGVRKRKAPPEKSKPSPKSAPTTSIDQLLADLEKSETANVKVEVEEDKAEGEEGREEEELEESDEEMDDGTDYNQNYFDNGEGYLEEDDDMDDGPTY